jgi:hypothetical protein
MALVGKVVSDREDKGHLHWGQVGVDTIIWDMGLGCPFQVDSHSS